MKPDVDEFVKNIEYFCKKSGCIIAPCGERVIPHGTPSASCQISQEAAQTSLSALLKLSTSPMVSTRGQEMITNAIKIVMARQKKENGNG